MSLSCQRSFGPAPAPPFSNPVSCETPLRRGPRHWGQSAAAPAREKRTEPAAKRKNHRVFMPHLLGHKVSESLTGSEQGVKAEIPTGARAAACYPEQAGFRLQVYST